jgi:hypothetical protein
MNWQRLIFPFWDATPSDGKYTDLDAARILDTIGRLEQRITERFPKSGLLQVCKELRTLAGQSEELARRLGPPIWPVRVMAIAAADGMN